MSEKRPTWKKTLLAPGSRPRAIVTSRVSVAPSGWENRAPPSGWEISGRLLYQGYWFTRTNVLTHLVGVVVLVSTQSKLARPNVLGLPNPLGTSHPQLLTAPSLEMWCRSSILSMHIILWTSNFCPTLKWMESCCFTRSYSAFKPLENLYLVNKFSYTIIQPRNQSIPKSELRIYLVKAPLSWWDIRNHMH